MAITSQFVDMKSSLNFFEVAVFLLPILVTGPSFMPISLLVLEFSTIFLYKGLTRNLEINISISGDWDELGISNLARMSLMKCL